jgi:predicted nucleic acid-binding protein
VKVLVDTSAWIDFLNGHASSARAALADLLRGDDEVCTCGIVVAEVFQGLRRSSTREEIVRLFRELTYLEPPGLDLYLRAADIYRQLRQRGRTIRSTIDCVIAAIAEESGCRLLARDRDLDVIVSSGVVRVATWPP